MVEGIAPEAVITIAIAALAGAIFLVGLITTVSLSRVKRRLSALEDTSFRLEEKHAAIRQVRYMMSNAIASTAEAANRITAIEDRLDRHDEGIADSQNQLAGHESRLDEHDTLLEQSGQLLGKNTMSFTQAIQRIHLLEEHFQVLKAFQRTLEQTRHRILDAFRVDLKGMSPEKSPTTEQSIFKGEIPDPSLYLPGHLQNQEGNPR